MAPKKKKADEETPDPITTRLLTIHAEERTKRAAKLAKELVELELLEADAKEKKRQLSNKVKDKKLAIQKLAKEVHTGTEVVDAQRSMFDEK